MRKTNYREYVKLQQLMEEVDTLHAKHRDLWDGMELSELGQKYDLRYRKDVQLGRIPNMYPGNYLTVVESLTLGVLSFLAGVLIYAVSAGVIVW